MVSFISTKQKKRQSRRTIRLEIATRTPLLDPHLDIDVDPVVVALPPSLQNRFTLLPDDGNGLSESFGSALVEVEGGGGVERTRDGGCEGETAGEGEGGEKGEELHALCCVCSVVRVSERV
jgi:hypothetical protein